MADPERIAGFMLKSVRKANRRYHLLQDGDHIAVGVSGGKDSQALLRLLARWQPVAPIQYQLTAIHITMPALQVEADRQAAALQVLCESLMIPFHSRPLTVTENEPEPLDCFRCSWNRRRTLFLAARDLNCNKVALGHHADDIATTGLINLFYHGRLESMAPRQEMFEGELTIVRPLALVEEKDIVYYARAGNFYQAAACCPQGEHSQRTTMAKLLRAVKKVAPKAQINLYNALERAAGWERTANLEEG